MMNIRTERSLYGAVHRTEVYKKVVLMLLFLPCRCYLLTVVVVVVASAVVACGIWHPIATNIWMQQRVAYCRANATA